MKASLVTTPFAVVSVQQFKGEGIQFYAVKFSTVPAKNSSTL